uniref:BAG domain-containing protein n=1 Tax=Megaselia scalaris TaxID=36166 RepID=T1H154_MEGSC
MEKISKLLGFLRKRKNNDCPEDEVEEEEDFVPPSKKLERNLTVKINKDHTNLELNANLERLSISDVDKFCGKEVFLESCDIPKVDPQPNTTTTTLPGPHIIEAMDIDGVSSSTTTERLTPPREFCDSPYHQHSESSMNFDILDNIMESTEKEEIALYIDRVNSRLATVELNVRTVRDRSQEDSLSQVNALIDAMITAGDPVISRQRCQHYLNSCSDNHSFNLYDGAHSSIDTSIVDKKFESALLGCTLDDQKNIKKRLSALMNYLNKQTIHE